MAKGVQGERYMTQLFENEISSVLSGLCRDFGKAHDKLTSDFETDLGDLEKGKAALAKEKAEVQAKKEECMRGRSELKSLQDAFEKEKGELTKLKAKDEADRKAKEAELKGRWDECMANEEYLAERNGKLTAAEKDFAKKLDEITKKEQRLQAAEEDLAKKVDEHKKKALKLLDAEEELAKNMDEHKKKVLKYKDYVAKFEENSKNAVESSKEQRAQLEARKEELELQEKELKAAKRAIEEQKVEVANREMKNREGSEALKSISEDFKKDRIRFEEEKRQLLEREEKLAQEIVGLKRKIAELEERNAKLTEKNAEEARPRPELKLQASPSPKEERTAWTLLNDYVAPLEITYKNVAGVLKRLEKTKKLGALLKTKGSLEIYLRHVETKGTSSEIFAGSCPLGATTEPTEFANAKGGNRLEALAKVTDCIIQWAKAQGSRSGTPTPRGVSSQASVSSTRPISRTTNACGVTDGSDW